MRSQASLSARTHQPPVTVAAPSHVPGSQCWTSNTDGPPEPPRDAPLPQTALPCLGEGWEMPFLEETSQFSRDNGSRAWSQGPPPPPRCSAPQPQARGVPSPPLGCPRTFRGVQPGTPPGLRPSVRAHGDIQRRFLQLQTVEPGRVRVPPKPGPCPAVAVGDTAAPLTPSPNKALHLRLLRLLGFGLFVCFFFI